MKSSKLKSGRCYSTSTCQRFKRDDLMRVGSFAAVVTVAIVIAIIGIPPQVSAGKTGSTTNVTTIVHDANATGTQVLLRSDDYNGSGEATYSASLNASVSSYLFQGLWYLRLYDQSIRTLYITPDDAINNSQPVGPPPGLYWQDVEMAAGCYDQNNNVVPLENVVTSSGNCGMILDLEVSGTGIQVSYGPCRARHPIRAAETRTHHRHLQQRCRRTMRELDLGAKYHQQHQSPKRREPLCACEARFRFHRPVLQHVSHGRDEPVTISGMRSRRSDSRTNDRRYGWISTGMIFPRPFVKTQSTPWAT